MGIPVLIIGKSGSGKSTSLRNFGEKEIGLINVSRKPLPFKKKFESTAETDDYGMIMKCLAKTEKKSIVIDDAGYLIVNMFMRGHSNAGSGNAVFGFYNKVGDTFWNLIEFVKSLPADKVVYFMMHEDKNDFGDIKPKTIGKILDEKVCLEGMFTIVLRATRNNEKYVFKTQTDGLDVCKTPIGMFEDAEIDNDLKVVDEKIRSYYEPGKDEAK
ncbi:MAG: ATP-binding protein [Sphaerochaeta sp.]|nr:ATP-binding protein [Sphaerochaeta sp.]